jgi:hypothetical protein
MKAIFLTAALLMLGSGTVLGQDHKLYWKYKDYDGAVALSVPGFAVDFASWFVKDKDDRRLMRKLDKVRVLVFENPSPVTARDLARFNRKAKRRHLDELLYVREGQTRIQVMGRERGNAIRKFVVLVQSPDEFVLVSFKGRFRYTDIQQMMDKFGKDAKKDGKPVVPPVVKVPVAKV